MRRNHQSLKRPGDRRRRATVRSVLLVGAIAVTVTAIIAPEPDWVSIPSRDGALDEADQTIPRPSRPPTAGVDSRPASPPSRAVPRTRRITRVPDQGSGQFRIAPLFEDRARPGRPLDSPDVRRYTVEVEAPLPFTGTQVARVVDTVLTDPRGWQGIAGVRFRRTDTPRVAASSPAIRILLASPATTDRLCAPLQTGGELSCRNGDLVVLNARRWAQAVPGYPRPVRRYRTYLVNHEVGHALGRAHASCPGPGQFAPVMQQQTKGLDGCRANGWPTS